jgi:hypothetical protein
MKKFKLLITSISVLFSVGIYSIEANQKVENFRLNDQLGNSHELFYYSDHQEPDMCIATVPSRKRGAAFL